MDKTEQFSQDEQLGVARNDLVKRCEKHWGTAVLPRDFQAPLMPTPRSKGGHGKGTFLDPPFSHPNTPTDSSCFFKKADEKRQWWHQFSWWLVVLKSAAFQLFATCWPSANKTSSSPVITRFCGLSWPRKANYACEENAAEERIRADKRPSDDR